MPGLILIPSPGSTGTGSAKPPPRWLNTPGGWGYGWLPARRTGSAASTSRTIACMSSATPVSSSSAMTRGSAPGIPPGNQVTWPTTARAAMPASGASTGALRRADLPRLPIPRAVPGYKRRGVQLVFHSFHAAHASPEQIAAIGTAIGTQYQRLNPAATHTYPGITMPAAMTVAAACNHVWISAGARRVTIPRSAAGPGGHGQ